MTNSPTTGQPQKLFDRIRTLLVTSIEAGVDVMTIALWLGHASSETTRIYLHADLALKERAIARTTPTGTRPGRYQPSDRLLAFLEAL